MSARNIPSTPLEDIQFGSVIRYTKQSSHENAKVFFRAVCLKASELDVPLNNSKVVPGLPNGSDQGDLGSILSWVNRITPGSEGYEKCVDQLVQIHATLRYRIHG